MPIIIIALCIALAAAVFRCFRWKKRYFFLKNKPETSESEKEYIAWALRQQIEYSALQSQINPHFLYNTLDSIRGEALLSGSVGIAKMTERLSRFFRYCISNKGDMVTIRDEIHNILDYFYIQEYRFGSKFQLAYDIPEGCYSYQIPKMSLQPIVENAIFHGLEPTKQGGEVRIRVLETERNVKIEISDDGVGMEENTLRVLNENLSKAGYSEPQDPYSKSGIALKNVNDRIRIQWGEEYGIYVRSVAGEGTDVHMLIPRANEGYSE